MEKMTIFLRKVSHFMTSLYIFVGITLLISAIIFLLFLTLYLVKSVLGIDILPGGHFWMVLQIN